MVVDSISDFFVSNIYAKKFLGIDYGLKHIGVAVSDPSNIISVPYSIFTEEEILAATLEDSSKVEIKNQQISSPEIKGDIENSIEQLLSLGLEALIVKKGEKGVSIYKSNSKPQDVPGFPVN